METMAGTRAPVCMWVDPSTVEYAALNQVRNVANLPWTHGVALMPDAHLGKGAISTDGGRLGIIPGSMGTGSYIVRGLANDAAFRSASHGAGRRMSRAAAKRQFTVEDLAAQTAGVECRKDQGVVDEIPAAYKDLESVMAQQTDLVQIVHKLTTLVCVKG